MEIVATAVALTLAVVLFWAGLEKVRHLTPFVSTLRQMGIPAGGAQPAALVLLGAELGVAVGLVLRPASAMTLTAVLSLAGAFAVSGLIALRRKQTVRCGCFGPYGNGYLGMNQIAAFPLWVGAVALLWVQGTPPPSGLRAASALAAVGLTLAALRAVHAVRAAHEARGDRRSADEMLVWLPR